jgi:hypothetical protein
MGGPMLTGHHVRMKGSLARCLALHSACYPRAKPFLSRCSINPHACADYITPTRIEKNYFTVPFFSSVGLSIVLKESNMYVPESLEEVHAAIKKPMLPFTTNMWYGTFIVVIFSAIVMWAIEHSHKGKPE